MTLNAFALVDCANCGTRYQDNPEHACPRCDAACHTPGDADP